MHIKSMLLSKYNLKKKRKESSNKINPHMKENKPITKKKHVLIGNLCLEEKEKQLAGKKIGQAEISQFEPNDPYSLHTTH